MDKIARLTKQRNFVQLGSSMGLQSELDIQRLLQNQELHVVGSKKEQREYRHYLYQSSCDSNLQAESQSPTKKPDARLQNFSIVQKLQQSKCFERAPGKSVVLMIKQQGQQKNSNSIIKSKDMNQFVKVRTQV